MKIIRTMTVAILLGLGLSACAKNAPTPLTAAQQYISERLEATARGDLVYDPNADKVWRILSRSKNFVTIEHNMNAARLERIGDIARWAEIVTNGLNEDPRYCELAEKYLSRK